MITVKNLFAPIRKGLGEEEFLTLWENTSAKIERIVSHAHSSPPGFWYDQKEDEWVLVVRGRAILEFENHETVELKAGDYLTIPRHMKHRVVRTGEETIWLVVHLK